MHSSLFGQVGIRKSKDGSILKWVPQYKNQYIPS